MANQILEAPQAQTHSKSPDRLPGGRVLPVHVPGAALHVHRPPGLRAGLLRQAPALGHRQGPFICDVQSMSGIFDLPSHNA